MFKGLTRCLTGRIGAICSDVNIPEEEQKVFKTLRANGYSVSDSKKWWIPNYRPATKEVKEKKVYSGSIPHIPGVSERIRNILKKENILVGI